MAIEGNLKDLPLAEIVQLNCRNKNTAQVVVKAGEKQGTIYFANGQVVHAEHAGLAGAEAFYRLLHWEDGHFTIENDVPSPRVSIQLPWQNLLLQGMKKLDEMRAPVSEPTAPRETRAPMPESAAPREAPKEVTEDVRTTKILKRLVEMVDGARAAHMVGADGTIVAASAPAGNGEETIHRAIHHMQIMVELLRALDAGLLREFLVFQESGQIIVNPLPGVPFFICLTLAAEGNIGAARLYLADVLSTLTKQSINQPQPQL